jgi:hypothetical protein
MPGERRCGASAEVGDLFMSLTYTCELNGADAFDYLTKLQKHPAELAKNPAAWMPWNYPKRCNGLLPAELLGKTSFLGYDDSPGRKPSTAAMVR